MIRGNILFLPRSPRSTVISCFLGDLAGLDLIDDVALLCSGLSLGDEDQNCSELPMFADIFVLLAGTLKSAGNGGGTLCVAGSEFVSIRLESCPSGGCLVAVLPIKPKVKSPLPTSGFPTDSGSGGLPTKLKGRSPFPISTLDDFDFARGSISSQVDDDSE